MVNNNSNLVTPQPIAMQNGTSAANSMANETEAANPQPIFNMQNSSGQMVPLPFNPQMMMPMPFNPQMIPMSLNMQGFNPQMMSMPFPQMNQMFPMLSNLPMGRMPTSLQMMPMPYPQMMFGVQPQPISVQPGPVVTLLNPPIQSAAVPSRNTLADDDLPPPFEPVTTTIVSTSSAAPTATAAPAASTSPKEKVITTTAAKTSAVVASSNTAVATVVKKPDIAEKLKAAMKKASDAVQPNKICNSFDQSKLKKAAEKFMKENQNALRTKVFVCQTEDDFGNEFMNEILYRSKIPAKILDNEAIFYRNDKSCHFFGITSKAENSEDESMHNIKDSIILQNRPFQVINFKSENYSVEYINDPLVISKGSSNERIAIINQQKK